jgi:UDP-N-acetylmuramate--alanine ligase
MPPSNGPQSSPLPRRIHLIGIGGIGMSAIARVLAGEGYLVSGSDLGETPITEGLRELGVRTFRGHAAEQIAGAEMVVASSAVPESNVEIAAARQAGLPVLKRQQFLRILLQGRDCIAVAGTHGKTTTSGMIATILTGEGRDPGFIVGGIVTGLGVNGRAGRGPFVIEADEYDRMFLGLAPQVAVVTNIEMDHPDYFRDLEDVRGAFARFVAQTPASGCLIACVDGPEVRRMLAQHTAPCRVLSYGESAQADYRVGHILLDGDLMRFEVTRGGAPWGRFALAVAGRHNALNATAAAIAAAQRGVTPAQAAPHLLAYRGAARRFEVRGEQGGVTVVDDYAHHPTEVRATLAAARLRYPGRRLVAVFQPHTYSRLRVLFDAFVEAFDDADEVIVLDVYAARAHEQGALTAADLVRAMPRAQVRHLGAQDEAVAHLAGTLRAGDVLITLSAGDGNRVCQRVLDSLARGSTP